MITFEGPQCMWTNPSQKSRQGSDLLPHSGNACILGASGPITPPLGHRKSISNLVGLANMVSDYLQQIVGGIYLCTSYFSGLLSPHIPPRPSPPECRIDDVEWPLGFFFTTFSIRQRDNDHGYFALLLLHLAQMVLGLEHQGLT